MRKIVQSKHSPHELHHRCLNITVTFPYLLSKEIHPLNQSAAKKKTWITCFPSYMPSAKTTHSKHTLEQDQSRLSQHVSQTGFWHKRFFLFIASFEALSSVSSFKMFLFQMIAQQRMLPKLICLMCEFRGDWGLKYLGGG